MREDGGLGAHLVGERVTVNGRNVYVSKLLGEGGFSYVYLVKDQTDGISAQSSNQSEAAGTSMTSNSKPNSSTSDSVMVLKITSIHSRNQRDVAEKEAKLLSRISHPSIVKMYEASYRTVVQAHSGKLVNSVLGKESHGMESGKKDRPQHCILMEYCEGGHALDVCTNMMTQGKRFDLAALIIAFGQICNAVSYLHAQRPPIVHRDLKPVNFLVKNGAYKLCDFGSAVFGHVELKTQSQRAEASEVIEKTTTQMFRAPEMVDLYMTKKLTQSTDVWALGCCLYSLAYFQNCFEENSNLAILSRNFRIPDDNPYGDGIVELIDRMLTVDAKARADMTEVILCLSAIYSKRPLPPRRKSAKSPKKVESEGEGSDGEKRERVGAFRTDGQGIQPSKYVETKKPVEAKKLNPNSAAARRRKANRATSPRDSNKRLPSLTSSNDPEFNDAFPADVFERGDLAFSGKDNPFSSPKADEEKKSDSTDDGFGFQESSRETDDIDEKDFVTFEKDGFWNVSKSKSSSDGEVGHEVLLGMENLSLMNENYGISRSRSDDYVSDGSGKKIKAPFADEKPKRKGPLKGLFGGR